MRKMFIIEIVFYCYLLLACSQPNEPNEKDSESDSTEQETPIPDSPIEQPVDASNPFTNKSFILCNCDGEPDEYINFSNDQYVLFHLDEDTYEWTQAVKGNYKYDEIENTISINTNMVMINDNWITTREFFINLMTYDPVKRKEYALICGLNFNNTLEEISEEIVDEYNKYIEYIYTKGDLISAYGKTGYKIMVSGVVYSKFRTF